MAKQTTVKTPVKKTTAKAHENKPDCGIIMPISEIDNYTAEHWEEVLLFLTNAISDAGFRPNLVSNSDEVKVIHGSIVENLGTNPIVICDVSGKNPNVMLELGMRLAFNLPVVIIKDNQTKYEFDISPIEHLNYPRDLQFNKTNIFRRELIEKIKATHEAATTEGSGYKTFLDNFTVNKPGGLKVKETSVYEFVYQEFRDLKRDIEELKTKVGKDKSIKMSRSIPPGFTKTIHGIVIDFVNMLELNSFKEVIDRGHEAELLIYTIRNTDFLTYGVPLDRIISEVHQVLRG